MALTVVSENVITKGMGGFKMRLVTITFDALYASGTGYTLTAAQVGLRKIFNISSPVVNVFQVYATLSGTGANLKVFKGASGINVEAATNEATLSGLVGMFTVWGY